MNFKPGDKVRVKDAVEVCWMTRGKSGVFHSWNPMDGINTGPFDDCSVEIDGEILSGHSDFLEPIQRPGLSAEDEKFVKDLQDALFSQLPDFNPKPRQGEIVQAGDV